MRFDNFENLSSLLNRLFDSACFDDASDVFLTALAPVSFVFTMGGFRPFSFLFLLVGRRFAAINVFVFVGRSAIRRYRKKVKATENKIFSYF